jgi:hypothetical protein
MKRDFNLRTVNVTRYITPCEKVVCLLWRKPTIFKYVLKIKGAGHGVKVLIAELMEEIARVLKLQIPS